MELSQSFFFEAAHTLRRDYETEGSLRVHGHTFTSRIWLRGEPDAVTGMIVDLAKFKQEIARVREMLDHRMLDEVPGLGAATLENLCNFIATNLHKGLPNLCRVRVERSISGDRCELTVS